MARADNNIKGKLAFITGASGGYASPQFHSPISPSYTHFKIGPAFFSLPSASLYLLSLLQNHN